MLVNPVVTALQKTYVRKVVDTLGDLDNVLWEISNESAPGAAEWEYEMVRTVIHEDRVQAAQEAPYVTETRGGSPVWSSGLAAPDTRRRFSDFDWDGIREAMGYARAVAERVELGALRPMDELASTGYCLAAPGKEYRIYLPAGGGWLGRIAGRVLGSSSGERIEIDLSAAPGPLEAEWIDVARGVVVASAPVAGGRRLALRAPFAGDALLHLRESIRGS
jgi:hypothetical protein